MTREQYQLNDLTLDVYGNGVGVAINYPDGTSTWLQGDDACEYMDTLDESHHAAYELAYDLKAED